MTGEAIQNFIQSTGFYLLLEQWPCIIMMLIACLLLYLAIVKGLNPCC